MFSVQFCVHDLCEKNKSFYFFFFDKKNTEELHYFDLDRLIMEWSLANWWRHENKFLQEMTRKMFRKVDSTDLYGSFEPR